MSLVGLHTALSGIRAARVGMDTTAHNVSNANTEGYTRQRVSLAPGHPSQTPVGKVGTGVTVTDIARVRDSFLDQRVRSDLDSGGQLDVRADLLARTEAVLGEPDAGLTNELNELWAAFEDLAVSPEDRATRRQVLSSLESLAGRVNSIDGSLRVLAADTATSLGQAVAETNGLLDQVADLNASILDAATGAGSPNDLLDERDVVLDQLSRIAGARATVESNGTVRVSISGMALVSGSRAQHLTVTDDHTVVHQATGTPVRPGGEIAGRQDFLTGNFAALTERLQTLTRDLVDGLNDQHDDGVTATGVQGGPLLSMTADAKSLRLEVLVSDPADLAAAQETGKPHDGRNATALADLRTTSGLDTSLRTLVTEHAAQVAAAGRAADGQRQLTASARSAREGMHGVSIDEEMVGMLSYQRALEASSRVMSAVDQALDTLINRTGVVGR